MPGENIQDWSPTAASNGTADTLINWAEGQPRASVNNSSRSEMAAHAKNRNLNNGSIITGGTANAQTFISGVGYTSVPTGLRALLKIGPTLTNTGAVTLNIDGIAAVAVKNQAGADLLAGALSANAYADLLYNGSNWILLDASPFIAAAIAARQPLSAFRSAMAADQSSWPASTFIPIQFNTPSFNLGTHLAGLIWTPPAGYVQISANAYANAGVDSAQFYLALYKNGAASAYCARSLTALGYNAANLSIVDHASGTDAYQMYGMFTVVTGAGGIVYSGPHSWFSGIVV